MARRRRSTASTPPATSRTALDFRSVYATVLERWWGMASAPVLGSRFPPLAFLPA